MKRFRAPLSLLSLLTALLLSLAVNTASANLMGTQVTGTMLIPSISPSMNFFDRANGYVPSGYSNFLGTTVPIGDPATEFGFLSGGDTVTANFNGSFLTLTGILGSSSAPAIQFRFTTLTPGAFASLALVSSNLPGLTFSVVGNTVIINEGVITHTGRYVTVFSLNGATATVPDSGTTALLLGIGLAALLLARQIAPLTLSRVRS